MHRNMHNKIHSVISPLFRIKNADTETGWNVQILRSVWIISAEIRYLLSEQKKFQNKSKNIDEVYQSVFFRCIMFLSYRVTFLCNVLGQIHYTSESPVRYFFYEKVVKWCYIIQTRQMLFWNLWEQHVKSYLFPCMFYACKAGLATCYVTTDGGIYTCSELPEFKIGTVKAGLDVPRIREIVYLNDKVDSMCEGCEYINHCKTRGCQTSNYEVNKDVYRPIEVNCKVTKWMYNLIKENLSEKQLNNMKEEYERRYIRHGK